MWGKSDNIPQLGWYSSPDYVFTSISTVDFTLERSLTVIPRGVRLAEPTCIRPHRIVDARLSVYTHYAPTFNSFTLTLS